MHVGHGHAVGVDAGQVEEVVHLLQQGAGVALDRSEAEALPLGEGLAILDELIHRAEDQGQGRAQLVADVGEEAGLVAVQLLEAFEGDLQLAVLARQLGVAGDLLGDVAPLRQQVGDLPGVIQDGRKGKVDDDGATAMGVAEDLEVAAHEAPAAGLGDHVAHALAHLFGDGPPAGVPEGLADHVGQVQAGAVEGGPVDLQHGAVHVQQAEKLVHGVEDDARHLLTRHLRAVGRFDDDAVHRRARRHPVLAFSGSHVVCSSPRPAPPRDVRRPGHRAPSRRRPTRPASMRLQNRQVKAIVALSWAWFTPMGAEVLGRLVLSRCSRKAWDQARSTLAAGDTA